MPRNLSAWMDLTLHLFVMLVFIAIIACYNITLALGAGLVWIVLALFARERCRDRTRRFERYCRSVISNVNEMMDYAMENLPQAVFIVDADGRIQWTSKEASEYLGKMPEQDEDIKEYWPGIIIEPVWGTEGSYIFTHGDRYFSVVHRPVQFAVHQPEYMALYVQDVTGTEQLRSDFQASRTVLCYIQIDNYDEVLQGKDEAERTRLLLQVNQVLDDWLKKLGGFLRRVSEDLYVAVIERSALDQAIASKFDVLDKARQIQSSSQLPITLSMGVAVADKQSMAELGSEAQAGLDLALGRGGDQVAVTIGGKTQFFGGRTKAVEKHTRVKARVVAHALHEIMETSDAVYIMGHHNEDFDCLGAAVGVAAMARSLGKPVHIVLSSMNAGIDKALEILQDKEGFENLFIHMEDFSPLEVPLSPLLIVVDTHIPHLVAAPALLDRIPQKVVIDHHRRSESFIKNPLLVYIEPASSSASELVTELLMYFDDGLQPGRYEATALYSGIVVDTKNFTVQTGVRTFDAAAYLRRVGADPVMVRHLFNSDYPTMIALTKALSESKAYPGGLIVAVARDSLPNMQTIAAQTADNLLRVDDVRMSIVLFRIDEDTVGISARSTGDLNVQVIMEKFGGGGHQNVAGAQVKGTDLDALTQQVVEASQEYIKETDKDESNS